jgi:hypothetical protein
MNAIRKSLVLVAVSTGLALTSGAGFAQDAKTVQGLESRFAELCDTNKDGMVSKEEMMKRVEMAWKAADPQNKGVLDKAATEKFLKMFFPNS